MKWVAHLNNLQQMAEESVFDGIGIQLSEEQTEQDFDGAEEEIASALSLPQLPPVEKQIREIEERQAALYAKEVTISAEVVDEVLRYGGNRKGSHLRIIYNFMIEQPEEAYTEFVQKEYGKGWYRFTDFRKGSMQSGMMN